MAPGNSNPVTGTRATRSARAKTCRISGDSPAHACSQAMPSLSRSRPRAASSLVGDRPDFGDDRPQADRRLLAFARYGSTRLISARMATSPSQIDSIPFVTGEAAEDVTVSAAALFSFEPCVMTTLKRSRSPRLTTLSALWPHGVCG